MARGRRFLQEVAEALGLVLLFVAGGLLWAGHLSAAPPETRERPYYVPGMDTIRGADAPELGAEEPRVWLIDGYNVLNVGLLAGRSREGWWRSHFREELLGRVARFEAAGAELWVVFDGAHPAADDAEAPRRVRSVFAPSADDWLLRRLSGRPAGEVAVVTADRRLAERAKRRGAAVVAPAAFLARCPAMS
ncbi:MAG: NYN domain-containing protein [Myxococcota bacterium]